MEVAAAGEAVAADECLVGHTSSQVLKRWLSGLIEDKEAWSAAVVVVVTVGVDS